MKSHIVDFLQIRITVILATKTFRVSTYLQNEFVMTQSEVLTYWNQMKTRVKKLTDGDLQENIGIIVSKT